jgi:hypothetical protein
MVEMVRLVVLKKHKVVQVGTAVTLVLKGLLRVVRVVLLSLSGEVLEGLVGLVQVEI